MTACRPLIVSGEQAGRTEVILARERRAWPEKARQIGTLEPDDAEGSVKLLSAVASTDVEVAAAAAWLCGRCVGPDVKSTRVALETLAQNLSPGDDFDALAYLEATMSLALLGPPRKPQKQLATFAHDVPSGYVYLAAYYLAQLGDSAAWPEIVAVSRGANEHRRIMAARHLVAFLPFEGQMVGGLRIDVMEALAAGFDDDSMFVRREAPALLAEADARRARPLIEQAASSDDETLREAAEDVLAVL